MSRLGRAFRCFFAILSRGQLPPEELAGVQPKLPPKEVGALPPAVDVDAAVQVLALLQREGRLVDFLEERIEGYADAQIGAAVREIHAGCKKVLGQVMAIAPVLDQAEDSRVEVPAGFDPSAIRLTGNVSGAPPFRGVLRHRGWRVTSVTLPSVPAGQDRRILAPAEVEVS